MRSRDRRPGMAVPAALASAALALPSLAPGAGSPRAAAGCDRLRSCERWWVFGDRRLIPDLSCLSECNAKALGSVSHRAFSPAELARDLVGRKPLLGEFNETGVVAAVPRGAAMDGHKKKSRDAKPAMRVQKQLYNRLGSVETRDPRPRSKLRISPGNLRRATAPPGDKRRPRH